MKKEFLFVHNKAFPFCPSAFIKVYKPFVSAVRTYADFLGFDLLFPLRRPAGAIPHIEIKNYLFVVVDSIANGRFEFACKFY